MKLQPMYTNNDFEITPFSGLFKIDDSRYAEYKTELGYSVFKITKLLFFFKERIRQKDFKTYEEAVAYIEFLTTTKWE